MDLSKLTVFRSSAGSGKTFQLAKSYVKLALENPQAFRHILAITFTNKATREMKERILRFLHGLSQGDNPTLLATLREELDKSPEAIQHEAKMVLSNILHQYSQFSISTIDSFFQKIIKSFAKELKLLGTFRIELDENKVRQLLIDNLMLELGQNKNLTSWVMRFVENNIESGRNWDIRKDIDNLSKEIFSESYKKIQALQAPPTDKDRNNFLGFLVKSIKSFENDMSDLAEQGIQIIQNHGLELHDFSYKDTSAPSYFFKIKEGEEYEYKTRVQNALENENAWYSKKSEKATIIQKALHNGLQETLEKTVEYYDRNYKDYNSANICLQQYFAYGILSDLQRKLAEYREEEDVMLISDTNVFLKGIIADNEAPFIYEKTGSRYHHFLLDEFQDTSAYQWENLKPLVENSLSETGRQNLAVGDEKQSIYRWRGGDWELLASKLGKEISDEQITFLNLTTNWRSHKGIIQFNNSLFEIFPKILETLYLKKVEEGALAPGLFFESIYQNSLQDISESMKSADKGYVEINFLEKGLTKDELLDATYNKTIEQIVQLQKQGVAPKDIAILVRNNREGSQLVNHLLQYQQSPKAVPGINYNVLSNDSLLLSASPAIRLLVNAIRCLHDNNDQLALVNVAFEYQMVRHHGQPDINENLNELFSEVTYEKKPLEHVPEAILNLSDDLRSLTIYELVEQLISLLELSKKDGEIAFLQRLQDAVLETFSHEKGDLPSFLNWWDESGHKLSIQSPENADAMQVITIHKSKGLEFSNVIIPFCSWKLDHEPSHANYLWVVSRQSGFSEAGAIPVKYSSKLTKTHFADFYYQELQKTYIDNLNLMYVALTRAKKRLFITAPQPKNNKEGEVNIETVGDLLYETMQTQKDLGNELYLGWQPDKPWSYGELVPDKKPTSIQTSQTVGIPEYISQQWKNKIAIKRKSTGWLLTDQRSVRLNMGSLMHEALSNLQHADQLEAQLHQLNADGTIDNEQMTWLSERISGILGLPEVAEWFSGEWKVLAESSIIVPGDHERRPDRVMIKPNETVVVDFKSEKELSTHKKQVLNYKKLLGEMGHQNVSAYLLYVVAGKLIKVKG
jgi:ATP-dependent helicase/nuclease subunit A